MKVYFKILVLVFILTLPLAGCFKSKEEKQAEEINQKMKDITNTWADTLQKGSNGEIDSNKLADTMGDLAQMGAEMELKEFKNQKSLDLPNKFPKNLVYSNAKVTAVENNSHDGMLSYYITLKTDDNKDNVIDFYKNVLKKEGVNFNESLSTDSYHISSEYKDSVLDIDVNFDQFSKLVSIEIDYSK